MRQYRNKYSKESLEPIVRDSLSVAGVIDKLGLKQAGGNHRHLKLLFKRFEIDTSHFTGSIWNRGLTAETDKRVNRGIRQKYTDDEAFCENSLLGSSQLKRRLLRIGWKYCCSRCGISDWLSEKIALHLDHINGINDDNRLCNLRFLCPNCHQLTGTWGSRNAVVVKRHTHYLEVVAGATP